jgi:fumarate hydratase class II
VDVGSAGLSGHLQLNVFMPVIAHDVLQSCG